MLKKLIGASLLACVSMSAAFAGGEIAAEDFLQDLRASRSMQKAAPSAVGDVDSFGRNVKWLGLLQTGFVSWQSDCTPVPGDPPLGPDDRCVTLNAAPASTGFDLPDIGRVIIPGKSANTLLCHWLTPILSYTLRNDTGVFQGNAGLTLVPYAEIENEVLNDPTLIDPSTGLPFGGRLSTGFAASFQDSRSMQPNDRQTMRYNLSRTCIGGFLTRKLLVEGYGLSNEQAKEFFRRDITIKFGVRGNASLLSQARLSYGLRVVGD